MLGMGQIKGMFSYDISVDLGTANTLIYVKDEGIVLNEPSVVAIATNDNKIVAVGSDAREMLGRTPETIEVMRPLRDGVIADYRVTEAMLHYFIHKACGRTPFRPQVMVSVPVGVTSVESRAVHEAALQADVDPDVLSFIHAVRVICRKLPRGAAVPPSGPSGPSSTGPA